MDREHTENTFLEFVPDTNEWKVGDAESQHMSPVRGYSAGLDITPPRVRRASIEKQRKKNAWKQAILEFRATHGTSDASFGSPSPSPPSSLET
jgi:hypothetical protein